MDPTYCKISQIMPTLAFFLLLMISSVDFNQATRTLPSSDKLQKSDMIKAYLEKINNPSIKTIQDPPEMPKSVDPNEVVAESSQLWSSSGESCPEGTIPIRRTTEQDVLRASSIKRFGRKIPFAPDSSPTAGHEYAIASATLNGTSQYYGTKAIINLWEPLVAESANEFSIAQLWVAAGAYSTGDLNTIEAGWQRDGYVNTGCYDLKCSGFVQTNNRFVMGGTITPLSSYMGAQYILTFYVWKDSSSGNWWLQFGSATIGYWPSHLFTRLRHSAPYIEFGGEIVNSAPSGSHTSTQMGSGHFPEEGFGKAAYFSNIQVVDSNNSLNSFPNLLVTATYPNCYNIIEGDSTDTTWGTYFYFGGPGRNVNCP